MTKPKTARKPKTVEPAPVDVEGILRESDERAVAVDRNSIRFSLDVFRRFAEPILEEPIRLKAGLPGLETPWLPKDLEPFRRDARTCLDLSTAIERQLENPSPSALSGVAVLLAQAQAAFDRMMGIFNQRDIDEGRAVPQRRARGNQTKRKQAADINTELRNILDDPEIVNPHDRANKKQSILAATVASEFNRRHPDRKKPLTSGAVEERIWGRGRKIVAHS